MLKHLKKSPLPTDSNRRTETWFRRGLWLVAVVFASFLIGLGGKIVDDLPKVESYRELKTYTDQSKYLPLEQEKTKLETLFNEQQHNLAQAELALDKQRNEKLAQRESYQASLATRHVTETQARNQQVFEKTALYEQLITKERELERQVETIRQQKLNTEQRIEQITTTLTELETAAKPLKEADDRRIELKIFLYRLAITLPLLLAAGWLFKHQRQSKWFPFVWGFIWFALFAFFVELVPYLPSYGGYVRYVVGIIITILIGRYAITAMYRYLERKQAEESQPPAERAQLNYDLAQARLAKHICPACERPLDFSNEQMDYCPHCSIQLYKPCDQCQTRSSVFNRYCYRCGAAKH